MTGGAGAQRPFKYGGDAGRYSAQVTNALPRHPDQHDLARLIAGTGRTFGAFARQRGRPAGPDRQLRRLHRRARRPVGQPRDHGPAPGADAADRAHLAGQPQQVAAAAAHLRDRAAAGGRRAARPDQRLETVARPGPAAALRQGGRRHRQAARRSDARAWPAPPRRARRTALPQLNQLSLCTTKVLVPTGNQTINDQFSTGGPELPRVPLHPHQLRRPGQNFDGNGPYLRVQAGGGPILVGRTNPQRQPLDRQDQLRLHAPKPASARSRSSAGSRR